MQKTLGSGSANSVSQSGGGSTGNSASTAGQQPPHKKSRRVINTFTNNNNECRNSNNNSNSSSSGGNNGGNTVPENSPIDSPLQVDGPNSLSLNNNGSPSHILKNSSSHPLLNAASCGSNRLYCCNNDGNTLSPVSSYPVPVISPHGSSAGPTLGESGGGASCCDLYGLPPPSAAAAAAAAAMGYATTTALPAVGWPSSAPTAVPLQEFGVGGMGLGAPGYGHHAHHSGFSFNSCSVPRMDASNIPPSSLGQSLAGETSPSATGTNLKVEFKRMRQNGIYLAF